MSGYEVIVYFVTGNHFQVSVEDNLDAARDLVAKFFESKSFWREYGSEEIIYYPISQVAKISIRPAGQFVDVIEP